MLRDLLLIFLIALLQPGIDSIHCLLFALKRRDHRLKLSLLGKYLGLFSAASSRAFRASSSALRCASLISPGAGCAGAGFSLGCGLLCFFYFLTEQGRGVKTAG